MAASPGSSVEIEEGLKKILFGNGVKATNVNTSTEGAEGQAAAPLHSDVEKSTPKKRNKARTKPKNGFDGNSLQTMNDAEGVQTGQTAASFGEVDLHHMNKTENDDTGRLLTAKSRKKKKGTKKKGKTAHADEQTVNKKQNNSVENNQDGVKTTKGDTERTQRDSTPMRDLVNDKNKQGIFLI